MEPFVGQRLRAESSDKVTAGVVIKVGSALLIGLLALLNPRICLAGAEYAIRWDPAEGGPGGAKETLKALDKEAGSTEEYEIQYFDLAPPANAPAGSTAILRQRKSGDIYELTFKYRGGSLTSPKCPLSEDPDDEKTEDDITILEKEVKRAESYSCTIESRRKPVVPPETLNAVVRPCVSEMKRTRSGKLKIEKWHLPGDRTIMEVSKKGKDTDEDLADFQKKVAKKLVKAGAKPSERSKTELGENCH